MKFKVTKSFAYFGEGSFRFKVNTEYTSGIDVKEEVLKSWLEDGLAVMVEEEKLTEVEEKPTETKEEKKPRKTKKKAE